MYILFFIELLLLAAYIYMGVSFAKDHWFWTK